MLKGKVKSVEKGPITASVKIEILDPANVTSIISKESVEDLDIKNGDDVVVIVKATEVMIAKE
jgi:molybdopterin-binding protein